MDPLEILESKHSPILGLVEVTASSISQVFILVGLGYFLARKAIIHKKAQNDINKLNVFVFTPALLFSKVAFSQNPAGSVELLIVTLGFVLVTLVSIFSAVSLSWLFRVKGSKRNFVIACAISPNSNSLPVALMQSLVTTVPQLRWKRRGGAKDTTDEMLGRALTYLVLFSTLAMLLRWSVGAQLLDTVISEEEEGSSSVTETQEEARDEEIESQVRNHDRVDEEWGEDETLQRRRYQRLNSETSFLKTLVGSLLIKPVNAVMSCMTPPLWASVASLIVALIPTLQRGLGSIEPLVGALQTAGDCSIPLTMVVLGAYFHEEKPKQDSRLKRGVSVENSRESQGTSTSTSTLTSVEEAGQDSRNKKKLENRTILISNLSRMFLTPLILIPPFAAWCLNSRSSSESVVNDPVFICSALLVIGSPPALTLAQITSQSGKIGGAFERLLSRTIFVAYAILAAPTTVILVLVALLITEKKESG